MEWDSISDLQVQFVRQEKLDDGGGQPRFLVDNFLFVYSWSNRERSIARTMNKDLLR